MATRSDVRMILQARPEAGRTIKRIAKSRDLKITAVIDVLIRGWQILTPEQQERAFHAPVKEGVR